MRELDRDVFEDKYVLISAFLDIDVYEFNFTLDEDGMYIEDKVAIAAAMWQAAINSLDGYCVNNEDGSTTIYMKKGE